MTDVCGQVRSLYGIPGSERDLRSWYEYTCAAAVVVAMAAVKGQAMVVTSTLGRMVRRRLLSPGLSGCRLGTINRKLNSVCSLVRCRITIWLIN